MFNTININFNFNINFNILKLINRLLNRLFEYYKNNKDDNVTNININDINTLFHGIDSEIDYIEYVLFGKLSYDLLDKHSVCPINWREFHKVLYEFSRYMSVVKIEDYGTIDEWRKQLTNNGLYFLNNKYPSLFRYDNKFNGFADYYKDYFISNLFNSNSVVKIPAKYSLNSYCRIHNIMDKISYSNLNDYCLNWVNYYKHHTLP